MDRRQSMNDAAHVHTDSVCWEVPSGVWLGYMDGFKHEKRIIPGEEFSPVYGTRWKNVCRLGNSSKVWLVILFHQCYRVLYIDRFSFVTVVIVIFNDRPR